MKEDVQQIGCVVMSGNNTTLYTICGTEIIQNLNIYVDLPSKHGRGGQSKLRFERLAEEARHNYVSKVIESILRVYSKDVPLIVGGPSYLKDRMRDRLSIINDAPKILRVVDIQYDKRNGLNEMMRHCGDLMTSINLSKEKKWIEKFLDSVSIGDNMSVYGDKNVQYCLDNGFMKTLIVDENAIPDEIISICKKFDTEIVLISSMLPEASQLKIGFGNMVGILRYEVEFPESIEETDDNDEYSW